MSRMSRRTFGSTIPGLGTSQIRESVWAFESTKGRDMRIVDYENTKSLSDVGIILTPSEAEELATYLVALARRPDICKVHLSEIENDHIEREITVAVI